MGCVREAPAQSVKILIKMPPRLAALLLIIRCPVVDVNILGAPTPVPAVKAANRRKTCEDSFCNAGNCSK